MIFTGLSKFRDVGLLILSHRHGRPPDQCPGWPKLAGGQCGYREKVGQAMGGLGIHFLPTFWGFCCAMTETFGGLLIILGLFFDPATMLLTINFIVAARMLYGMDAQYLEMGLPRHVVPPVFQPDLYRRGQI